MISDNDNKEKTAPARLGVAVFVRESYARSIFSRQAGTQSRNRLVNDRLADYEMTSKPPGTIEWE
jgi:GMP synthase PP-ATPase subunit